MPLMVNSASQPLQYEHDGTRPAKTATARTVTLKRKLLANDGIHRAVPRLSRVLCSSTGNGHVRGIRVWR